MFLCFSAILITSMLKDLKAQEKDTITFEVNVNYEGITYKWLKNGVEIRSSEKCQTRTKQLTHSLTIRNVHFGDGGEYSFVAGSAKTSANLYIEGKYNLYALLFQNMLYSAVYIVNIVNFVFQHVSLNSESTSKT